MPYPKHTCELTTGEDTDSSKYVTPRDKIKNGLRNLILISPKNFRSHLFLRTKGAIQREMMKQKKSKHWYIVHPFSLLRLYWEIFLLFIFFIFTLFLSFRSSFLNSFMAAYYRKSGKSLWSIYIATYIDLCLSAIVTIDLLGFFVTGYYDPEKAKVVMTPQEIRKNYIGLNFVLDLSSSFPVDAFYVVFAGMNSYAKINQAEFIFLEMYSIYRLIRFRRAISYISQCVKLDMFSLLFFRIALAFLIYCLLMHWMMALSIIVPQTTIGENLYNKEGNETLSWIQASHFLEMSLENQYLTVLMKALQNNIGANESAEGLYSAEDYLIALFCSLLGRIYFLFFLFAILETTTAESALKAKFRMILDQLQIYMKQKDLPVSIKKRMSRFYLYRFQAHYFSNRAMLGRLTESLRKEISMYTCQRLLHNTEVFQSVPRKVLTRFVQRMNREMYFPKDVIIQGNTFGECMYFICSGSVAVETLSEREICKLGDGDFFGEIALIVPDRRRTATVTALTITEVYRLEYSDFKSITDLYPDIYNRLEKYALERYKTTVLVEGQQK